MIPVTPDGARYLHRAAGHPVARPFNDRRLIPTLCRQDARRWVGAQWLGLGATLAGTALLAPTWAVGAAAALLLAVLPFIGFNLRHPILVDLPAMGLATLAAGCWSHGWFIPAMLLSLTAGAAKETAPVFAALYAWAPWLLIGLVPWLVLRLVTKPGPDILDPRNADILAHPLRHGILASRDISPALVAPWGAAIVGVAGMTWQLCAVLALAYAQLLIATDRARLYMWAAPTLCLAACTVTPLAWAPVLILVTWANPVKGGGL